MKRNTELAVLYVGSKNNCIFFEVFDKTDGMRSLGTVKQYPSRIDFLLSDQLKPDVFAKNVNIGAAESRYSSLKLQEVP
ncbi:TPA: hypothetical protein ACGF6U_002530 [Vibrio cholerae]